MRFLVALVAAFSIGHAYRTLPAALGPAIAAELALEPWALGVFGGAFNVVFAAMQLPIGVALDRVPLRRLVAALLATAALGAAVGASATSLPALVASQALFGIGCSGLWLAVCVHVARSRPASDFAWTTTVCASLGSSGMFLTTTPLALVVEAAGWRVAMACVGALTLALLALVLATRDDGAPAPRRAEAGPEASMARLLRVPAIFAGALLGLVSYGCLLAIRGLWVGPYLEQAQGLSPSAAGNVAFIVSAVMIAAPLAFGLADRRGWPRAPMLAAGFLVAAAALLLLGALRPGPWLAAVLLVVFATGASAFVLQYADIRAAAPPGSEGRALSLLNLAFLIGVASCQVGAGALLAALGRHLDPAEAYGVVLALLGAVLAIAALAFLVLRLRDQRVAGASRIQEPASKP